MKKVESKEVKANFKKISFDIDIGLFDKLISISYLEKRSLSSLIRIVLNNFITSKKGK